MSDRNTRGRFAPGNKAAVGRAAPRTQNEYISATVNRVPLSKWHRIVDRAVADAETGDHHARRFLADYLLGKPPQVLDLRSDDAALIAEVMEALAQAGYDRREIFGAMLEKLKKEPEKP